MKKILSLAVVLTAAVATYAQTEEKTETIAEEKDEKAIVETHESEIEERKPSYVEDQQKLNFVRQVYDRAVYVQNISSKINLGISGMGKDITIDGKLQMRRNEVIRLTIVPFGLMEVARIEFTPEYVLLVDRMHKEYVKASYAEVPFIKAEGISFYTLQSLFWNELFQPGKEKLGESDLKAYSVEKKEKNINDIEFEAEKINYQWTADDDAYIKAANITYCKGSAQEASVNVIYGRLTPVGVKHFPAQEKVTFRSKALSSGAMSLNIDMGNISTDGSWDARTNVSDRYRQVTAEEFMKRLGNL